MSTNTTSANSFIVFVFNVVVVYVVTVVDAVAVYSYFVDNKKVRLFLM